MRLNNGDMMPVLSVAALGGDTLELPDRLAGTYGVILIYRGAWCPYCNAQLASFQRALSGLAEANAQVVALSVDDEQTTASLVRKHRLTFPVGYGADADKIAELTGAYVNDEPRYLQSTGIILDPEGRVLVAVYSSSAIGRLVPIDVIGFLRYVQASH